MNWIELAQDIDSWQAHVSALMKFRISKNAGNFLIILKNFSFSRTLLHGVNYSSNYTMK